MQEQEELIIIHKKLSVFPSLKNKKKAILRRNLLTEIKHPELFSLLELDLYDNKINSTEGLNSFPSLIFLDLSFNLLKRNNIPSLIHLKELYLIANDIEEIEEMNLPSLIKLDMAENSIKQINNLKNLSSLKELYLGNNFITKIENIPDGLTVLDLQNNPFKVLDCNELPNTIKTLMLNDASELECIINLEKLINLEFLGILRTRIQKETLIQKTKAEIWN